MPLIKVQVAYRRGIVKEFVADGEMLLDKFCRRVRSYGEVRSMRGFKDALPSDAKGTQFLDNNGE